MPHLVAIALSGPEFVDELRRAWDRGDAVLPVDTRLPPIQMASLLAAARPASLIDEQGTTSLSDGVDVEPGDALVVPTSGTTGTPKGVVLTHDAVAASADASSDRLRVAADDHWLACLPLAHVGGLSVVTRALHRGTRLTTLERFDAETVTRWAMNRADRTLVSLVPTMLDRVDASLFATVLLGGSAIPIHRPDNTVATYGLTESGSGVVYDGRPLDGVEIRVEADGRVALRAPMLLRSYRFGHDDRPTTLDPHGVDPKNGDGWFLTSDIGSFTTDGRLQIHGRADDVINTGGEKVWPDTVERVLSTHHQISEVAVAGRPDPQWGQRVVAWIVPVDRHHPPTLDDLRDHCRAELAAFCAPREVVVVEALPRTTLGKIQRNHLK
ncbi:MAG: class I adenylate-forming enzyme family protein [Acidimicrobiia bacterium]